MDLRRRFDEVLQVCPRKFAHQSSMSPWRGSTPLPGQEIAQIYKLAMLLILNIDDPPPILSPADALAIEHDRALRANDCKGDHCL